MKSLKPGAAFSLPGSWLPSGGWVRIDVDKKILLTHYYDVRDKLTGRRTRYMHPITATRACPIKTFDECIIGGNTIELPEGSTWETIATRLNGQRVVRTTHKLEAGV